MDSVELLEAAWTAETAAKVKKTLENCIFGMWCVEDVYVTKVLIW